MSLKGLKTGFGPNLPGVYGALRKFPEPSKPPEAIAVEARPNGTVYLVIPGAPMGKPRMTRQDKWEKRPAVVRYREWCNRVRSVIGDSIPPVEQITAVNWIAYFKPPKTWSKEKRAAAIGERHRSTPDLDNICKGLFDCLFKEDQAIAACRMEKWWDSVARLEVEIVAEVRAVLESM